MTFDGVSSGGELGCEVKNKKIAEKVTACSIGSFIFMNIWLTGFCAALIPQDRLAKETPEERTLSN